MHIWQKAALNMACYFGTVGLSAFTGGWIGSLFYHAVIEPLWWRR